MLFVFSKYTYPIKVTSTSGGTHDFRVSLDSSDPKRLLCFCRKGSGVSSHISKIVYSMIYILYTLIPIDEYLSHFFTVILLDE